MKKSVFLLATFWLGISTVLAQTNYANLVLTTPNLLGYWRFSSSAPTNSSVGTNTSAFSGDAHIGPARSGPALADTPGNTAVLLDGNGDFVTTTLVGGLTNNQGSMIAWFNLAKLPSVAGRIFTITGESQGGNDFDLQIEGDNKIKFYTDGGSATVDTNALTAADTNVWHFVAVTFTASTSRKIYLDGALVASSTPGGHNPAGTGVFAIGESHVFTGRFFEGAIDEAAIFNRELTGAEITNLYIGYSPAQVFTPYCTNVTVTLSAGSNNCVVVTNDVTVSNNLVAWYKADGNANDSYGTNNAAWSSAPAYDVGRSGQAFFFNPSASNDVELGNLTDLDHASGVTFSTYIKLPPTNQAMAIFSQALGLGSFPPPPGHFNCVNATPAVAGSWSFSVGLLGLQCTLPFVTTNYSQYCPDDPALATNVNFNLALYSFSRFPTNQWVHVAFTWRSSDGLALLYSNGIPCASTNSPLGLAIPPYVNSQAITNVPPGQSARTASAVVGATRVFVTGFTNLFTFYESAASDVDNFRIYTRALSAAEIQQLMQADAGMTVTNCTTSGAITTNLNLCTTPKGELTISRSSPTSVNLAWPAGNNIYYLLQSSDELTPLAWTQLWAGASAGSNVVVNDSTLPRQKRFYRLLSNQ